MRKGPRRFRRGPFLFGRSGLRHCLKEFPPAALDIDKFLRLYYLTSHWYGKSLMFFVSAKIVFNENLKCRRQGTKEYGSKKIQAGFRRTQSGSAFHDQLSGLCRSLYNDARRTFTGIPFCPCVGRRGRRFESNATRRETGLPVRSPGSDDLRG